MQISDILKRVVKTVLAAASVLAMSSVLAQDALRIGAINPYSGPLALYGDECARGYQLAIDLKNASGGVLGRKVELVRGDASTPQQGVSVVDQLATRDKVDAFIGTYISAVSSAASDAALRHQKIYWDTNALAIDLTERRLPNFVRSGPNAVNFGEVSVHTVLDAIAPALKINPRDLKVWVEHEDTISGKSIGDAQVRLLKEKGAQVLGQVDCQHRFRPAHARLRELMQTGAIGRLGYLRIHRFWRYPYFPDMPAAGPPGWRQSAAQSGGWVINDIGSHRIDLALWLTGRSATVAGAVMAAQQFDVGTEDSAAVLLALQGVAVADITEAALKFGADAARQATTHHEVHHEPAR